MRDYVFIEGGLQLNFRVFDEGRVALTYFGIASGTEECPEGKEVGECEEKFDGHGDVSRGNRSFGKRIYRSSRR